MAKRIREFDPSAQPPHSTSADTVAVVLVVLAWSLVVGAVVAGIVHRYGWALTLGAGAAVVLRALTAMAKG